jgi:hypothetical protein
MLDINNAPVEELRLLRGIGPITARRIVANRAYDEPYDLVRRGVLTEGTYEKNADGSTTLYIGQRHRQPPRATGLPRFPVAASSHNLASGADGSRNGRARK